MAMIRHAYVAKEGFASLELSINNFPDQAWRNNDT